MNQKQSPTDQQDQPQNQQVQDDESSSGCGTLAMGCGIAGSLVLVGILGVGLYLYYNFQSIVSGMAASGLRTMVKESKLPEEQEKKILNRIDKLKKKYDRGDISTKQLGNVAAKLSKSPILKIGTVRFLENAYIKPSDLSDREKKDAHRTMDRLARGLDSGKIKTDFIDEATKPLQKKSSSDQTTFKSNPDTQKVKAFIERVRKKVNEKKIADKPFEYDFAEEFDRAITEGLQEEKTGNSS